MFVARVTGSVVSTQKVATMKGHKLLIVEPLRVDPANRGKLVGTGREADIVEDLPRLVEQRLLGGYRLPERQAAARTCLDRQREIVEYR